MTTPANKRILFQCAFGASVIYIGSKMYRKLVDPPCDIQTNTINKANASSPSKGWSLEVIQGSESLNSDPNVLVHVVDMFSGIRIDSDALPSSKEQFRNKLSYSLRRWQSEGKRGIFLKIALNRIHLLEVAIAHQFTIHHARPEYVMLNRWLPLNECNMIPDHCHCYISVGSIVVNQRKEVVVIQENQEKWSIERKEWWKIPGGAIDRCENIHDAAVRETKEETGLDAAFMGIFHFRHFHPFRFENTSDIYFVCLLKYNGPCDGGKEFIRQEHEIAEVKWMEMEQFLSLPSMSRVATNGERNRIREKVDLMVEHWDDDDVDLELLYPEKMGLNKALKYSEEMKKRKEYFVFGPSAKKSSLQT